MISGAITNFAPGKGGWRSGLMRPSFAGSNAGPSCMGFGMAGSFTAMNNRFTIDGSQELEDRLEGICGRVQRGATALIPRDEIAAIVLGGGYGRGEGGVLKAED